MGVKTVRKIIRVLDEMLNLGILAVLCVLLAYGIYALWDVKQIYRDAEAERYEVYKPDENDSSSFLELQKKNAEVIGWITVYGTSIDYPLLQGKDNRKYLNTNAEGEYDLAGAIFVDAGNKADFSDYNTIIHGHHMNASIMFGDLSKFTEQKFFEEHEYGSLYVNGRTYRIHFFSFSLVDAYTSTIYRPGVSKKQEQQKYLQTILDSAMHQRDVSQSEAEHIVLLSTCSTDITNGRHILAGILTEEIHCKKMTKGDDYEKN